MDEVVSFGNFAFLSDFTFLSDFLTGENRFEVVRCRDNDGSTSLSDIAVRQFVERRLEPDLGKVVFTSTWGSSGTDLFKVFSLAWSKTSFAAGKSDKDWLPEPLHLWQK